jgi:hypothetical protein
MLLDIFLSSSTTTATLVDAALQCHGAGAGRDQLLAFAVDGLRQDGGGGGAVAGDVARLAGDFLDHLGAHVFELVFQGDFLGDRDAVLGHGGGPERFFEHDVAALGSEGDLDRVGQDVDAPEHLLPGL